MNVTCGYMSDAHSLANEAIMIPDRRNTDHVRNMRCQSGCAGGENHDTVNDRWNTTLFEFLEESGFSFLLSIPSSHHLSPHSSVSDSSLLK